MLVKDISKHKSSWSNARLIMATVSYIYHPFTACHRPDYASS